VHVRRRTLPYFSAGLSHTNVGRTAVAKGRRISMSHQLTVRETKVRAIWLVGSWGVCSRHGVSKKSLAMLVMSEPRCGW